MGPCARQHLPTKFISERILRPIHTVVKSPRTRAYLYFTIFIHIVYASASLLCVEHNQLHATIFARRKRMWFVRCKIYKIACNHMMCGLPHRKVKSSRYKRYDYRLRRCVLRYFLSFCNRKDTYLHIFCFKWNF